MARVNFRKPGFISGKIYLLGKGLSGVLKILKNPAWQLSRPDFQFYWNVCRTRRSAS